MDKLLSFDKWKEINEARAESFNDGAREWFLEVSNNAGRWKFSKILKTINNSPDKKSLNVLKIQLQKESTKPGKEELLGFIQKIEMQTYKTEFKKIDGPNSAIDELFKLIKQSIEY